MQIINNYNDENKLKNARTELWVFESVIFCIEKYRERKEKGEYNNYSKEELLKADSCCESIGGFSTLGNGYSTRKKIQGKSH